MWNSYTDVQRLSPAYENVNLMKFYSFSSCSSFSSETELKAKHAFPFVIINLAI